MLISLLLSFAWAADWDLCAKTPCTESQAAIQQLFNDNVQFAIVSQGKYRYTGSCWQKNSLSSVDPNEKYFSLFHFYAEGALQMRGVYSFGEKENPFPAMSEVDTETYLDVRAPNRHSLEKQPDLALFYQQYSKSEHFTWYRTNASASELYLVHYSAYEDVWEMNWCLLKSLDR